METLALSAVVLDDNTRATNDLARVALAVDLAETSPGTEDLGVTNLNEVDLVLGTERLNELDILGLSASLDEDAQVGLAFVEGLGALAETASKTVVNKGVLQNLLEIGAMPMSIHAFWTVGKGLPGEHPQRRAFPWELRREPQPRPRPQPERRLQLHLQRQTSYKARTPMSAPSCQSTSSSARHD